MDPLYEALVQCLKLLRRDDTRQRVEWEQPFLKRTVFVQTKFPAAALSARSCSANRQAAALSFVQTHFV